MFELSGKYGKANVYAETIDDSCISQIYGFLNNPITKDVKVLLETFLQDIRQTLQTT